MRRVRVITAHHLTNLTNRIESASCHFVISVIQPFYEPSNRLLISVTIYNLHTHHRNGKHPAGGQRKPPHLPFSLLPYLPLQHQFIRPANGHVYREYPRFSAPRTLHFHSVVSSFISTSHFIASHRPALALSFILYYHSFLCLSLKVAVTVRSRDRSPDGADFYVIFTYARECRNPYACTHRAMKKQT